MPVFGRRHADSYDRDGRGRWTAALAGLIALLAAAVIGWSIGQGGGGATRTVTRTVPQPPPTIYQDTFQGAVLAAAAFASKNLTDQWSTTLGYRVVSFTPTAATLETVARVLPRVKGRHTIWIGWNIHVAYQRGQWLQVGDLDPPPNTPPFWTTPPAILQELKPWPPV
jgi:hypothetical protein